jgi:hypothetical protein
MVAGGTSSSARGRGATRKLLSGRTLPKDSISAPYKLNKNPVGRPRSKSRTKSEDNPESHQEPPQEDSEMEEDTEDSRTDMEIVNPENPAENYATQQQKRTRDNTFKGKEKATETTETQETLKQNTVAKES